MYFEKKLENFDLIFMCNYDNKSRAIEIWGWKLVDVLLELPFSFHPVH